MKEAGPPASPPLDRSGRRALEGRLALEGDADAELVARVKARVMRAIDCAQHARLHMAVASGMQWKTVAPGVERKIFSEPSAGQPTMWRLAPGATVPAHFHEFDEECLVLEGSLQIDDVLLHAGAFHLAGKGTTHEVVTTDTGALVYLRGTPGALLGATPIRSPAPD